MQICFVNPQPILGNDHRLGANEAPPAIISIFLRRTAGRCYWNSFDQYRNCYTQSKQAVYCIPVSRYFRTLHKDATDRNRTSPFAFTGNKFEFRMVGSRDSIARTKRGIEHHRSRSILTRHADILEKADDFDTGCT